MVPIIGIVVAMSIIAAIEVPALLNKRWTKELWVFSILLIIGTTLFIAQSLHAQIPNPLDWISIPFKPISEFILTQLHLNN